MLDGKKVQIIIKALDALGVALANEHHKWTNTERKLYEKAIAMLTS